MSSNWRGVDRISESRRTSPCVSSVQNLGRQSRRSRRASASRAGSRGGNAHHARLPHRPPRKFLPSQPQVIVLLSMAIIPEERVFFRELFWLAAQHKRRYHRERFSCVCNIPISWIAQAYRCDMPLGLRHPGDVFPNSELESAFFNDFHIVDVILNR